MFRSMTRDTDENVRKIRNYLLNASIVICDEGHKIRNFDTVMVTTLHKINTKLRIVFTGYLLQNNLEVYWSILNFINQEILGTVLEFKTHFAAPITNGQFVDSTSQQKQLMLYRSFILTTKLSPYVHRRSENIIQSELPENVEYTLIFRMTELQEEL